MALHRTRQAHPNGFIESFNGRLCDECLNEHLFSNLAHAREIIEAWKIDYNTKRPHTSLGGLTPTEFAARPPGITGTDSFYERGQYGEHVNSYKGTFDQKFYDQNGQLVNEISGTVAAKRVTAD